MCSDSKSVLVTGALGWIGRNVCTLLRERGHRVLAFDISRGEGPWEHLVVGSLNEFRGPNDKLQAILQNTDIIIHCAGRAHRPLENAEEQAMFREVNVEGTRGLLRACELVGQKRFVYISTIAAYDWDKASESGINEQAELNPLTYYAVSKLEGERLVRESSIDWRVVRLATVFGSGDRANFAKMALGMKKGRFLVPGTGCAKKSVIPVELAASAIVRMGLEPQVKHRLVNVALPNPPTLRELCDAFSEECGFKRVRTVPLPLLWFAARIGDMVGTVKPGFPLSTANVKKLTTSTVVDVRKFYECFPEFPKPTVNECIRQAADYYRGL